ASPGGSNEVKRSRRRGKFHRAPPPSCALRGFRRGVGCRLVRSVSRIPIVVPALLALAPAVARADGAPFPNTQAILVPADRPGEIWLPTNFGIVASHDGGRTWTFSCEQGLAANPYNHQFGPAPRDRLFALAGPLIYSDDGACGWQVARGLLDSASGVGSVFADPTNADRVLAAVRLDD